MLNPINNNPIAPLQQNETHSPGEEETPEWETKEFVTNEWIETANGNHGLLEVGASVFSKQKSVSYFCDLLRRPDCNITHLVILEQWDGINLDAVFLALKENSSIEKLAISRFKPTDAAICSLAEALEGNKKITSLAFFANWSSISDTAVTAITKILENSHLTHFSFRNIKIDTNTAKRFSEAIQTNESITDLVLQDCMMNDDAALLFIEALKKHKTVTHFNIGGNSISSKSLESLSKLLERENTLINKLNLSNCSLNTGTTPEILKSFTEALIKNTTLVHLNLNRCVSSSANTSVILRAIARVLKENNSLLYLDLSMNCINDQDSELLSESLKINKTLVHLDIAANQIEEKGYRLFCDVLKTNHTLREILFASGNLKFSKCPLDAVLDLLRNNQTLVTLELGHYSGNAENTPPDLLKIRQLLASNQQQFKKRFTTTCTSHSFHSQLIDFNQKKILNALLLCDNSL